MYDVTILNYPSFDEPFIEVVFAVIGAVKEEFVVIGAMADD